MESAPARPSRPPALVRGFAVALRTWSAAEVLVRVLLGELPALLVTIFAGGGSRPLVLATVALVLDLAQACVTFFAARALLVNRPWARPWIICVSLVTLAPVVLDASRWEAGFSGFLQRADDPLSMVLALLRGGASVLVAGIALLVLVVYEPVVARHGGTPAGDWALPASVVFVLLTARYVVVESMRPLPAPPVVATKPAPVAKTRDGVPIAPGQGTLRLRPIFDGQPLTSVGGAKAYVTLGDRNSKRRTSFAARVEDGAITLRDVPAGDYGATVVVDADADNPVDETWGMPGDYQGNQADIPVRKGGTAAADVSLSMMLRLLAPEDTQMPLPLTGDGCSHLTSPVGFEWAPVPRASQYRWGVWRQSKDGKTFKSDPVRTGTTSDTWAGPFELSPSAPGEYYGLDLTAMGSTGPLTKFTVPRSGSLRHIGYCFLVR